MEGTEKAKVSEIEREMEREIEREIERERNK